MRWFDSDFDYVQELADTWNKRQKKMRITYFILAVILIIAGILTAVFPIGIFAIIQYLAALAVIILGISEFISYTSMTYHFKDPMLIITGVLNILLGNYVVFYAGRTDCSGNHLSPGIPVDLQRSAADCFRVEDEILPHTQDRIPDVQRYTQYHPCCYFSSSAIYVGTGIKLHPCRVSGHYGSCPSDRGCRNA